MLISPLLHIIITRMQHKRFLQLIYHIFGRKTVVFKVDYIHLILSSLILITIMFSSDLHIYS